jgi:2-polyprenyl-3-methyl-5-hydroxy-6-metoxy-1,4-benzoquinol methylase
MKSSSHLGASFRDPSGFLFIRDGILYRQVNRVYAENYARLIDSGLYEKLVKARLLIPHIEAEEEPADPSQAFQILMPERVPFISYPYEWSFGQLKDAALATLSIQKRALKVGLSLKDSSAYNIQFWHGKPVLIDTLSFEIYREGEPWVAYRQFCQHFLAPLALMTFCDVRLGQLLRVHIDGIPLDLASKLLPGRTRWNLGLASHIHLHARAQARYAEAAVSEVRRGRAMSKQSLLGLIENLEATVRGLTWKPTGTEWAEYYNNTNYSEAAFAHKEELVAEWLAELQPKVVWDLGANTGIFSRQAASLGAYTLAFDIDPAAVERNYQQVRKDKQQNLLPLVLDLTNPSPGIGWANRERDLLTERGLADVVLALALIHHLAIANNVPFDHLADYLSGLGKWLIVEFVPKSDSQVKRLLKSRADIFTEYDRATFEQAFSKRYIIQKSSQARTSERWLYLMEKR